MGSSNNPNNVSCTHFLPLMRRTPISYHSPQKPSNIRAIYHIPPFAGKLDEYSNKSDPIVEILGEESDKRVIIRL